MNIKCVNVKGSEKFENIFFFCFSFQKIKTFVINATVFLGLAHLAGRTSWQPGTRQKFYPAPLLPNADDTICRPAMSAK